MTNQIVEIAPLSEEKLLKILPDYFGIALSPVRSRKIGDVTVINGSGKIAVSSRGDEKIEGSSGKDVVISGPAPGASSTIAKFGAGDYGDDTLSGMLDDDVLVGGKGNNTIWGGNGDDYLYGDQLQIQRASTPSSTISDSTSSTISDSALSTESLGTISSSTDGNDFLFGGSGNDFLHGGGGDANFLRGGSGSDTVIGDANSKRDVLIGKKADTHPDDNLSDYLESGGAPYTYMEGGGGNDVFDITATGPGDYVKILDFSDGDKIKLPHDDSIAVLYDMVINQSGVEWDWEWVATETDDGVTIPLDDGALLYLQDAEFDDLTASVSATTFEIT